MNIKTGFSLAACLLVASGCGGGSDGAEGSVSVYVTDYFGQPVAGAELSLSASQWYRVVSSNEEGNVTFDNVPSGRASLCGFHSVRGFDGCGDVIVPSGGTVTLDRRLKLSPRPPTAAVLDARVDGDGLSPDGRTLDVIIRVAVSPPPGDGSWFNADPVWVEDCLARESQELEEAGPRCIRGSDGSDASYTFGGLNAPPAGQTIREPVEPATVALLMDQSTAFREYQERESRLFTAKVFADKVLPDTILLLAAFAGDDAAGVNESRLPQTPVTFLPEQNPGPFFTKADAFAQLDELTGLGGGISPLYAAIRSSIDFVAGNAIPGTRRILVVMASGRDDACEAPVQCEALRDDIVAQARDKDVELVLQGDYGGWGLNAPPGDGPLRSLAVEASAPLIFGPALSHQSLDLVRQFVTGVVSVEDIRVRLTSEMPGAFHPGATVVGVLHGSNASNCPWDCQDYPFPFAVQVP